MLIIGLGFVGLTFAAHALSRGFQVHGVEKNKGVVKSLKAGVAHFHEANLNELLRRYIGKDLHVFDASLAVQEPKFPIVVITVGTPLDETNKLNFEQIRDAWVRAASSVQDGGLIVLRSTVAVGTSRQLFEQLDPDRRVTVAFCPERTIEGRALEELPVLPQLVAEMPEGEKARAFFELLCEEVVTCNSLEQAEAAKLFCNVYRDLHFSLANVFELVCQDLNINAESTFLAASRNYDRLDIPSPGFVGGPCLSKDAYILADSISDEDLRTWILSGRSVNERRLKVSAAKVRASAMMHRPSGDSASVLLCGMAFKGEPVTDDLRDSPSLRLYQLLRDAPEIDLIVHDFEVTDDSLRAQFRKVWTSDLKKSEVSMSLVVIANSHKKYRVSDAELLEILGVLPNTPVLRL